MKNTLSMLRLINMINQQRLNHQLGAAPLQSVKLHGLLLPRHLAQYI